MICSDPGHARLVSTMTLPSGGSFFGLGVVQPAPVGMMGPGLGPA